MQLTQAELWVIEDDIAQAVRRRDGLALVEDATRARAWEKVRLELGLEPQPAYLRSVGA